MESCFKRLCLGSFFARVGSRRSNVVEKFAKTSESLDLNSCCFRGSHISSWPEAYGIRKHHPELPFFRRRTVYLELLSSCRLLYKNRSTSPKKHLASPVFNRLPASSMVLVSNIVLRTASTGNRGERVAFPEGKTACLR
jgi:hypothetical protein